jgi:ORF6N domain
VLGVTTISASALYGVENRTLLQPVRRNLERFPADFMFQLCHAEVERSRSQTVILNAKVVEMAEELAAVPGKILRQERQIPALRLHRARCRHALDGAEQCRQPPT